MAGYPTYGGNYNNPPPIGFEAANYGVNQADPAYPPPNAGSVYNPQSHELYNVPQSAPNAYQAPYQPQQQPQYPQSSGFQASHTNHGDSMNHDTTNNLPPVGFDGLKDKKRSDAASESHVKLDDRRENSNSEPKFEQTRGRPDFDSYRVKEKTAHSDTLYFQDGKRRIDYVLAYEVFEKKSAEWNEKRLEKRTEFEANLEKCGLQLEREGLETSSNNKTCYVKIHAPWQVLAQSAEEMLMKMPIRENDVDSKSWTEKCFDFLNIRNPFELREEDMPEQPNYFTCAFRRDRLEKFIIPDDREKFFTSAQRGRIVYRILGKTRYGEKRSQIGIGRLIGNNAYSAAYPLHEGPYEMDHSLLTHQPENDRQILYNNWVKKWYKMQPLDLIRDYFGEKIGIYFAWLGFYTEMLIPAAIIGWVCVIYGLAKLSSYTPVKEICESTTEYPMCPRCDKKCNFWPLNSTCNYSRAAYVFDNEFTVVFAIFMSLWATMFLEFWKRKQAEIAYEWDLIGFEDEEERPRPEYEAKSVETKINPITKVEEPYFSVGRRIPGYVCGCSFVVFMLSLVIIAVFGVVVYRVVLSAVLAINFSRDPDDIGYINMVTAGTAALINLVIILLLNKAYEYLARLITNWEMPRTQTQYEDSYTFKMYMFQFMNFYSSLFYIAFAKLSPGRPGKYNRILSYRAEECNPAGCITELLVQLAVIMVGKQIFNNILEVVLPKVISWWKQRRNKDELDTSNYARWELDYALTANPPHGLFYEYLEMVIQFGFITLFVTAFPLGPFFALINNLVEVRLDAYKYTSVFRRPMCARAQDIGIWYAILNFITKISVVVNGFTIAFVSEFVPRLYYELAVSGDGSLKGFVNNSLSCFDVRYFYNQTNTQFITAMIKSNNDSCGLGIPVCRFRGYYERPPPGGNPDFDYSFSKAHWHILAAKLFFLIAFLHVVFGVKALLAWLIPDVPKEVSNQIKRENFLAREALRSNEPPASELASPALSRSTASQQKEQGVRTNLDI